MNHFINPNGKLSTKEPIQYITVEEYALFKGRQVLFNEYYINKNFFKVGYSDEFLKLIWESNLNDTQFKILFYLLSLLRNDSDMVSINPRVLEKKIPWGKSTMYDTLREFKNLGIIIKLHGKKSRYKYQINPRMIFNGDRISFIKNINPGILSLVDIRRKFS